MRDKAGRLYAKLSELKVRDVVQIDDGFNCRISGEANVYADELGKLYFKCEHGRHYLDCQADDGEHCIGVYAL
jgi:hypothetical protein